MDSRPEISIIIPVYKVEKYLARCLDSVLAQTFTDFEVICVNDGSPDNSAKILEDYAQKDARVKILAQQNQGQAAARNNGLRHAQGEYIYFLDSDDCIHPQLLEIAYRFITKYNAGWVTFKHDTAARINPPLYKNIDSIPFKITDNPLFLYKKNLSYKMTFYLWERLYKKELLQDIKFLPGNAFEDDPFILAICAKRPKTVLLKEPLYYYVDNSEGVSNKSKKDVLPKHIKDYHEGILYVLGRYLSAPKEYIDFLAVNIIAKKFRIQYNKIKKTDKKKQPELWKVFTEELIDLDKKNLLRFSLSPRNLFYWIQYQRLIKKYKA